MTRSAAIFRRTPAVRRRHPPFGRASDAPAALFVAALIAGLPGVALASTPRNIETGIDSLPAFTAEAAARDPQAAEARCRAFVTALYHRLRTEGANPARSAPGTAAATASGPFAWVMETYFALAPPGPGVRAAAQTAGDQTRAYLDAFGPAALADTLPADPLFQNDKRICTAVLGRPGR